MIRVGIINASPLTTTTDDMYSEGYTRKTGLLIDIWETIAKREGINYKYVPTAEWMDKDMIDEEDFFKHMAKEDSKIDIYLGDAQLNAKFNQYVDFSYPFYYLKSDIMHYQEPVYNKIVAFLTNTLKFLAIYFIVTLSINSFVIKDEFKKQIKTNLTGTLLMFTLSATFSFLHKTDQFSNPKAQQVIILKYIYTLIGFLFLVYVIASIIEILKNRYSKKTVPDKEILSFDYNPQIDIMQSLNYPYKMLTEKKSFYTGGTGDANDDMGMDVKEAAAEDAYTASPEEVRGNLINFYLGKSNEYSGIAPIPNMYRKYQNKQSNDPNNEKLKKSPYYFPISNVAIAMKKSLPYSYKQSINKQIIKMAEDGTLKRLAKKSDIGRGTVEDNEIFQIHNPKK